VAREARRHQPRKSPGNLSPVEPKAAETGMNSPCDEYMGRTSSADRVPPRPHSCLSNYGEKVKEGSQFSGRLRELSFMKKIPDRRAFLRIAGVSMGAAALYQFAPKLALGQAFSASMRDANAMTDGAPRAFSSIIRSPPALPRSRRRPSCASSA